MTSRQASDDNKGWHRASVLDMKTVLDTALTVESAPDDVEEQGVVPLIATEDGIRDKVSKLKEP